jgi:hypothetical protein
VPENQVYEEEKLHAFLTSTTKEYRIYGGTSAVMTLLLPVTSEFSQNSEQLVFTFLCQLSRNRTVVSTA